MCSNPEFLAPGRLAGLTGLLASTVWLAACGAVPARPAATQAAPQTVSPLAAASSPARAVASASPPATAADTAPAPAGQALMLLLAYADRVRAMNGAELGQEATRLSHPTLPAEQLQLALVLSQLRQTPELIRAQELLTRLLANAEPDAQALHPLARLLAARYGEQRRLEDLLDKQTQQTREVQRRLDQTSERLEALKAIERSLTNRPHTPAAPATAAPSSRARTPATTP